MVRAVWKGPFVEESLMKKVDKFYKHLESQYDASYEYIDERLTTFEAREILKEIKIDVVDASAAKILIDNWFELNTKR